jgi:hypothetical protein
MLVRVLLLLMFAGSLVSTGCGTTRWSDTARTATEQLLISDAVDRAVSRVDFRALSGRKVYLDTQYVAAITDSAYLTSTVRQQMLASGCIVKAKAEEADYIVEVRAGAVGTDRNDLLYGVPATQLPAVGAAGIPSSIPEIPLVKKTHQRGVAKVALFAYNRQTGRPVWQSGVIPMESKAKDVWVFGAGPFQQGSIYEGTKFAGNKLDVPLIQPGTPAKEAISVADEAYFVEPAEELAMRPEPPKPNETQTPAPKSEPSAPAAGPPSQPGGPPPQPGAPPSPPGVPPPGGPPVPR